MATSDELLEMPRVPRTAAFVGAGVIGMELSHVLARAGCERVVLLELGPRALPQADADAVAVLVEHAGDAAYPTFSSDVKMAPLS